MVRTSHRIMSPSDPKHIAAGAYECVLLTHPGRPNFRLDFLSEMPDPELGARAHEGCRFFTVPREIGRAQVR